MPSMAPVHRLSEALKPVLVCMWIAGLYIFPVKSKSKAISVVKVFFGLGFFGAMLCSIVALCAYYLFELWINFRANNNVIMYLYHSAYVLSMLLSTVGTSVLTPRHLRKLLVKMDDYYERYDNRNLSRLRLIVLLIFIAPVAMILPIVFPQTQTSADVNATSYVANVSATSFFPIYMTVLPVRLLIIIYTLIPPMFLGFVYFIIYYLLQSSANRLVKDLMSHDRSQLEGSPALVEQLRIRHDSLCKLIAQSSAVLGHFLAAGYGGFIPCLLFLLHGLVYRTPVQFQVPQFVGIIFSLVSVTLTGTILNKKMHKPAEYLMSLNIEKMSGRGPEIVSAFLSRLEGRPIGFHVYHLFTIDTSTIVMVCGTILTYALVIIQFQP